MKQIKIGTMVRGNAGTADYIRQIAPHGFECCEITFGADMTWIADLDEYAAKINQAMDSANMEMSAIAVYGNPLADDDAAKLTRKSWEIAIDNAAKFRTNLVCGFTGRLVDKPIPESIPAYKALWSELAARAKEKGVRIAFENCFKRGNWKTGAWNIAVNPSAWNMMFEALPTEVIGLEWEPAHQMHQLIEPLENLREWVGRIYHVHGKDCTVDHAMMAKFGIGSDYTPIRDRTPGFGDTNWTDVISILREAHYEGNIDIEGWHDPVYRDELEMTGQVYSMNYLKQCRGGSFIANPTV